MKDKQNAIKDEESLRYSGYTEVQAYVDMDIDELEALMPEVDVLKIRNEFLTETIEKGR